MRSASEHIHDRREQRLGLAKHAGRVPENEENEDGEYIYTSQALSSAPSLAGGLGLPIPEYISIHVDCGSTETSSV